MIAITVLLRCRTCGNEDEAVVNVEETELRMVFDGAIIEAKGKVAECKLCKRPLVLAG